jgi:hypothetical protein
MQTRIARAERDKTRVEKAKADRINAFLQDMLGAANPRNLSASERARGRGVTVLEAMNEAAKKVDAGFELASGSYRFEVGEK